ncbi:MAG: hypothetical protein FWC66_08015 [Oscillospiraceae bacterium]|nr:hypothetical protein [Oscillospiraceae bacterium]
MLKKIAIPLVLILATLLFASMPVLASTQFQDLVAESAVLVEVDSGEVLFAHNMNLSHPADALARIMTLHLAVNAIESYEAFEDDLVEMTQSAWEGITSRNTTLNIRPGEIMPLSDLMLAAFVGGAAEACNMIAEHIAGSVDAFIEMMNARASEIGAVNTVFINTHGLFDEGQNTTAMDQFLIFREAISSELFLEISGVFRHTLEATNTSDVRRLIGSNSLLNRNSRYFFSHNKAGIASITFEGGHSYVGLSEQDDLSLIVVILGSDEVMLEDESFDLRNLSEARRLSEWGYAQFGWRTILPSTVVARAPVTHGAGADFVNLRPETEIRLLLNHDVDLDEFVRHVTIFSEENDEPLIAPVETGDILGEITITRNGEEFGPIPLLANTNVELHNFEFIRRQVMDILSSDTTRFIIFGLIFLVVGYIALLIRYNVMRRKRFQKIAQAKQQLAEDRKLALEEEQKQRSAYYGTSMRRDPFSDTGPYRSAQGRNPQGRSPQQGRQSPPTPPPKPPRQPQRPDSRSRRM